MTEEERFQRDWTLSEEIDQRARADLERGLSIDQAMENVLRSEAFSAWRAEKRTFRVDWDRREHYEDLLGGLRSEAYAKRILSIGERYMADPKAEVKYRTVRGYSMPDTLRRLMEIGDDLRVMDGMSIEEGLGVSLHFLERYEYECAPEDAIPFASTGMGGDHLAFLTKDDTAPTLEEAPILFIQPMDFDVPVKFAARNLKEFLSLFLALKDVYVLERFPRYETEEQFLEDYRDNYLPAIEARSEALRLVTEAMERKLGLSPIGNVYAYVKNGSGALNEKA